MESIKISKLEFNYSKSGGARVLAHINQDVPCVEFTKDGSKPQTIMATPDKPAVISFDPFIQFAPPEWDDMIEETLGQMVELWNEKYS